jgi:NAD(P)-dependent dehydrogenase (short-subunit alcohol dehydrogenase family)
MRSDARPQALVTGGSGGLGLACARRLLPDFEVTICGRRLPALVDAAAGLDPGVHARTADVTDEDGIAAVVEECAVRGPLRALVVGSGGSARAGPFVAMSRQEWTATLDSNLLGLFLTLKAGAVAMARSGGGSIVALSSIAGSRTHRNLAAYSTAKAGADMLVRVAADELGASGIRVNAVAPGLVPTPASDALARSPEVLDDYLAQMPLGRVGTPDDVARAVAFLIDDDSSWVTGQVIHVDGGHVLRRGPDISPLLMRGAP